MSTRHRVAAQREVALVDLIDRLLAGGVVLGGDITLSIADVNLVDLYLRVLITPSEELESPAYPPGKARPA
ncbi:MAG TPA: gas vesicle protein [Solirubrobacteraceae bacterium]|nr:gas vesicle protein [Solirubrobacteraceae bacterium]